MTDYSDLPQVNTLYSEQQLLEQAIGYLQNGGTVTNMTIAPAVAVPPDTQSELPVRVDLTTPPSTTFIDAAITAMQQRSSDISAELASLGVTNPPARR